MPLGRRWLARRAVLNVSKQFLESGNEALAEISRHSSHHPWRAVPMLQVVDESLALGGAHGLLAPDDVPAERRVVVEQLVIDAVHEVARSVVVHVHLLDDDALLPLDLLWIELRVAKHV